ncbi:hypothetical protein ALT1644_190081 [Alteromonas macleodii]
MLAIDIEEHKISKLALAYHGDKKSDS